MLHRKELRRSVAAYTADPSPVTLHRVTFPERPNAASHFDAAEASMPSVGETFAERIRRSQEVGPSHERIEQESAAEESRAPWDGILSFSFASPSMQVLF